MPAADPDDLGRLGHAAQALLNAHRHLGAEHQALVEEDKQATAKERQGTLGRMHGQLRETAALIVHSLDKLATTAGLLRLGIDGQTAQDGDGRDYTPLPAAGSPEQMLLEACHTVVYTARHLAEAFEPTRKYPALAVPRCPGPTGTAIACLRQAVEALAGELAERGLAEESNQFTAATGILEELQARLLGTPVVPGPAGELSPEQVAAAILANPQIAAAAEKALRSAATAG